MTNYLEQILQEQEAEERIAYQSAEAVRRMIQNDFSNSADILQAIDADMGNLAEFFRKPPFILMYRKMPLPIRKCEFFHGAKHTLSQIPYLHSHSFYEYIYILRGKCVQRLENREEALCLKARQSCLLAPGVSHIMEQSGKEDIILKFSVSERIFQEAVMPLAAIAMENGFAVFEHGNAWTDMYAGRLLQESRDGDRLSETAIKNYLSLIFIELLRAADGQPADIVKQLEAYFERNPREPGLRQFAASIGYSADYAGRMIKSVTGKTFGEYLRNRRLLTAAKLLSETDYTVEYISERSGYETISGFYKQFYRVYGMAPGEYRKGLSGN